MMDHFQFQFELEFEPGSEPGPEPEEAEPRRRPIYTIAQLNREARQLLEGAFPGVWVEGEVSNFRHHSSGHMYFTLKDEEAEIDAVIFALEGELLEFEPEDGQRVLAFGRVTLYERRGRYQLVCSELRPAGLGRLQLELERLKARLQAEGLFAEERKRPLPRFPQRIGVVTSPEGAAIRDICTVIAERYPPVEVVLFPTRVQGEGAAEEIAQAIQAANRYSESQEPLDLLIVGRGGGSLEDLWAFNEEVVARAISESKLPVISAVGHEVDLTIADLVADYRAPTPTAAAQAAVPDCTELLSLLEGLRGQLVRLQGERLEGLELRLERALRSYAFRLPKRQIEEGLQRLDGLWERLLRALERRLTREEERLAGLVARLEGAGPLAVLRRGYALLLRERTGEPLTSAAQVAEGELVRAKLYEGELLCRVERRELQRSDEKG